MHLAKNSKGVVTDDLQIKDFKERIKQLFLYSSAHGLPRMIRTDIILIKIIWLIVLICSICLGLYFISSSIEDYYKYDVNTKIDVINEKISDFPSICICSTHRKGLNYSLEKLILHCKFNRNTECKSKFRDYFEAYNDHVYGLCYRFNSGKNLNGQSTEQLKSKAEGYYYGFQLELSMPSVDEVDEGELIVNLYNQSSPPFDLENTG